MASPRPWLKLRVRIAGFPPGGGAGGLTEGCLGFALAGGGGGAADGFWGVADWGGLGAGPDLRIDPLEEDGLALGVSDGVEF